MAHFIAYLSHKGMSLSTVTTLTYVSGINHYHKLHNLDDTSNSFLIAKLIEGFRSQHPQRPDSRVPISQSSLKHLTDATQYVCYSKYESILFSVSFSLAFFALLRVSELAVHHSQDSGHTTRLSDITFHDAPGEKELHLKIRSSKTDQRNQSVSLILSREPDNSVCPVILVQEYLKISSSPVNRSDKLMVPFDGSVITKYQFRAVLQNV